MTDEVKKEPFECVVSADLFRRALLAVSKEETRYYLNGVNIESAPDGGALIVATDGRRLLAFRDAEAHVRGTGIVQLSKVMIAALGARSWQLPNWHGPLTGKGIPTRYVVVRGNRAAVVEILLEKGVPVDADFCLSLVDDPGRNVCSYQWADALIEGTFPYWRKTVGKPDLGAGIKATFDSRFLAPLAEALNGKGNPAGVRLVPTEGDQDGSLPMFVFAHAPSVDGFGILMGLRRAEAPVLPSWALPAPALMAAE